MSNSAFAKFRDKATAPEGIYMKPSEIIDTQRFKVIPWLYKGLVKPIHFFFEGWVTTGKKIKGKDEAKPIRFDFNNEGGYDEPEDIEWARGDYGIQKPKPTFAAVVADFKTETIRVLSGSQKTLLGPLSDYCFDESEKYVKNWNAFDILITRNVKTEKFTSVERDPLEKEDQKYPKWLTDALEEFQFSLDAFMACEKTEKGEGTTYQDVIDARGVVPTKDEVFDKPKSNYIPEWGETKTQKGTLLSTQTEEQLKKMKEFLDEKGKTDSMLYHSICSGLSDFAKQREPRLEDSEDIPF